MLSLSPRSQLTNELYDFGERERGDIESFLDAIVLSVAPAGALMMKGICDFVVSS
jgi:hypothetical protein